MAWTKRQFISNAYAKIGMASYQFDIQPEEFELAKQELDMLLSEWNAKGIRLGYPASSNPTQGNLDDDTLVPDSAFSAVSNNLAVRLAPIFGKQVSPDLKGAAFTGYNALLTKNISIPQVQLKSSVPAGAGNRWRQLYSPFLISPTDDPSDESGEVYF